MSDRSFDHKHIGTDRAEHFSPFEPVGGVIKAGECTCNHVGHLAAHRSRFSQGSAGSLPATPLWLFSCQRALVVVVKSRHSDTEPLIHNQCSKRNKLQNEGKHMSGFYAGLFFLEEKSVDGKMSWNNQIWVFMFAHQYYILIRAQPDLCTGGRNNVVFCKWLCGELAICFQLYDLGLIPGSGEKFYCERTLNIFY